MSNDTSGSDEKRNDYRAPQPTQRGEGMTPAPNYPSPNTNATLPPGVRTPEEVQRANKEMSRRIVESMGWKADK